MLLLMLTAREGRLSSRRQRLLNRPTAALRLKSLRGIAVVCLGADAGARHGVKTGENAALLNRR
jgi:hypothetical protein